MNVQTVNVMKMFVAVMQLLSEDVRTDRQTDRQGDLKCVQLKIIIEKALIISAVPVNPPTVPKSKYYHKQSASNNCSSCKSP